RPVTHQHARDHRAWHSTVRKAPATFGWNAAGELVDRIQGLDVLHRERGRVHDEVAAHMRDDCQCRPQQERSTDDYLLAIDNDPGCTHANTLAAETVSGFTARRPAHRFSDPRCQEISETCVGERACAASAGEPCRRTEPSPLCGPFLRLCPAANGRRVRAPLA